MMSRIALALLVAAVGAFAPIREAAATAFDAETVVVNVNAGGNTGSISNVLGIADITRGSVNPGPDHGSATASTVGFYSTFVISDHLISNLGKADAAAATINTNGGPTGIGAGAASHFRLFIEVIADPLNPPPDLSAVPVDVGWHVAGFHTSGGNDFAEILVAQLAQGGPNAGQIIKFVEDAVDTDHSGTTRVLVNLSVPTSLSDQLAVDLRAQCFSTGFSVIPQVTNTACEATADPTFSIPSDYPFRDRVTLGFSPNLAPAAVPQPAAGWLVTAAVIALVVARMSGSRRRAPRR